MGELWATVLQGLLTGGTYAVTGLGLMLVFGVLRLVNLAHGELVLAGGYLAYAVCSWWPIDPLVAMPLVALLAGSAGWALHRGLLGGLARSGPDAPMVATFGVALLLQAAFAGALGNDPRSLPGPYSTRGIDLLGVRVQLASVVALVAGAAACALVWWALQRTRWGMAVRASGSDPVVLGVVGVDVRALHATVFGVAAATAAIGGVVVGISTSFSPAGGGAYLVVGFTVVVLGGVGSVSGMFVAALLIGVLQTTVTQYIGGAWRDVAVYALFLAAIALRPQGLLGRRGALA